MSTRIAFPWSAGLSRRAWPALLTALTLACVTPPAPADASQPPASAPKAPPAQTTPPPAPAPAPSATNTTPSTAPPQPPATPAAPASAGAESPCDANWGNGRASIIQLGQRQDDGKPLQPFRPSDPMYPYELRGGRFLFGEKDSIVTAVGRFEARKDAEEALKKVEAERPSAQAFITTLGPYLLPETRTCKVTRQARGKNPTIEAASWLLEKAGVLLAGSQTPCKDGRLTKQVTVMSCDGMKNLLTDTSEHACDHTRPVETCVYTLEPGVVLFEHEYTLNGVTSVRARAFDVRKKKQVYKQDFSNGSGLPGDDTANQPETDFEDVDGDGIPELVVSVPDTGQRTSVRKWRQGKFVETRSP
ncbi:hypothetical protein [Pyxidicoccus xibeiensis]|uniref:hypothetical protein n=1 Tax=Pyxidicoccus xibeiensis TaxID=2906759 RepID=UPI0020A7AF66|nr:hypothetical protein [Pyxidicoccus xibeiensis]MCP3144949.1 hypothetical protein [Pyxidicoccus xibeiensis]